MIYHHDLHPILFHLGPLAGTWYGLMYAMGFLAFYWGALHTSRAPDALVVEKDVGSLFTYGILGLLIGGRLGYVLFYGGSEYLFEPWRILQTWKGGMSFHGGLLGVTAAIFLFARRYDYSPLRIGDFGIPWIAIGIGLGRVGNFINGELYGKPTDGTWGVIFPSDTLAVPRHPSQLYEAVLEGLVVFLVLQWLRIKVKDRPGIQPAAFLVLYGFGRFLVEFVRLPDAHIGYTMGWITRGQMLTVPMILAGAIWLYFIFRAEPQPPPVVQQQGGGPLPGKSESGKSGKASGGKKNKKR